VSGPILNGCCLNCTDMPRPGSNSAAGHAFNEGDTLTGLISSGHENANLHKAGDGSSDRRCLFLQLGTSGGGSSGHSGKRTAGTSKLQSQSTELLQPRAGRVVSATSGCLPVCPTASRLLRVRNGSGRRSAASLLSASVLWAALQRSSLRRAALWTAYRAVLWTVRSQMGSRLSSLVTWSLNPQ
jgi:hypothetical protein